MLRSFLVQVQNLTPLTPYSYAGQDVECDVCGCEQTVPICDYDRRLKTLKSVSCANCGLVRTAPMPTEAELTRYYATNYRRDYHWTSKPSRAHLTRRRREAAARLSLLGPRLKRTCKILDMGCGAGEFLAAAARKGHRCLGLDPGQHFATYARTVNGVEVHNCGWQDASFEPGHFDIITLHHVLEHLRKPTSALRRLHEWLADDGVLYVAVPNLLSRREQLFEYFHFAHVYSFSPQTLVATAMVAGFEPDPLMPSRGTVMVFRKREAGPLPRSRVQRHCDDLSERFSRTRPLTYLLSGRWLTRAVWRLRKGVRDVAMTWAG